MSERIELWATVRNRRVQAYYRDADIAARLRHPDEQIVRLVELREGEEIYLASLIAALTERAEKAEAALMDTQKELDAASSLLAECEQREDERIHRALVSPTTGERNDGKEDQCTTR